MVGTDPRRRPRLSVYAPVVATVLALTAVPVELRPLGSEGFSFRVGAADVIPNVIGYVPVGIAFNGLGTLVAVSAAAALSAFAEVSQLVAMHRDPSVIDIISNTVGAIAGLVIARLVQLRTPRPTVRRWHAAISASAAAIIGLMWTSGGAAHNPRGATLPGALEGHWKLDRGRGQVAADSSGHGLDGTFANDPRYVADTTGDAVVFDGRQSITLPTSSPLRLVGSMTASAWIKPTAFPVDDAAIVSAHNPTEIGYQLDTTVDRGMRTIGFKLAGACGNGMARYGATPLNAGTWYHVAGVYNADARTLNVFLNGKLDDGDLIGPVDGRQRSSRWNVLIGQRTGFTTFGFIGELKDVRLYSRAQTREEIVGDMRGDRPNDSSLPDPAFQEGDTENERANGRQDSYQCASVSDREDRMTPGAAVIVGMLVAFSAVSLYPSGGSILALLAGLVSGCLLLLRASPTLPTMTFWAIPFLGLIGGGAIAASLTTRDEQGASDGQAI